MTVVELRPTLALTLLWIAPVLTGCGGSTTVPVFPSGGQVLFRGKPLEGVQVAFRPASTGGGEPAKAPVPAAKTDQDGKFRLFTAVGEGGMAVEGAPAGEYIVTVTPPGRSDSAGFFGKGKVQSTPDLIGLRYADAKTSGLKATIKPGTNDLEPFDLKETGGAAPAVPSISRD